jgi:N-hydroxyarylamine O-acetyltransferase
VAEALDLEAYFERLHWRGPRSPSLIAPSLATLAGLLEAHTARIPFEGLDVLLGRPIRLDLAGLQAKLVGARRGGYCFEHATLFAAVLEALGFAPLRHSARVILFQPRGESPRTHMFLTVPIDGIRYVVDPGFGLFGSRLPLLLDGGATHPTDTRPPGTRPSDTHRMAREGRDWVLYAARDGVLVPAWVSSLEADSPVDFELANHYVATHPDSPFVTRLMASAITPRGRVNVMNRSVTRLAEGVATAAELPDRAALRALFAADFGFDLPELEQLRLPSEPDW